MNRAFLFACLLAIAFAAPRAFAADRTVQQPMGGIAGNHPYFYSGKTGQDYARRVGSGFRQIEFQRIRIIPRHGHGHGNHRVIIVSPHYYWNRYHYCDDGLYGTSPGYGRTVEPRARTVVRSVAQVQPRVPDDPWAMLAGGHYDEAVGAFAMKVQEGDGGANVGYAIASALKGDHGQAAWAMRKAAESGRLESAAKKAAPLSQRLRELANAYESDATLVRWQDDRWFLAAAMHYLRGDAIAARKAIDHLDDTSEQEASTAALRKGITGR
jgi:hypothetical protein